MGIYDRDYMRSANREPGNGKSALIAIIAINVMAFIFMRNPDLALQTGNGFHLITLFQLVTAGFLHHGFGHIFFNMWGLYLFGTLVTPHISGKKFTALYLTGVITGNLLFWAFAEITHTQASLVGASGAVCAVMAAAATLEPNRRFTMIFMPFNPLKTTTLVICYTVLDLLFFVFSPGGTVAHLAHLGGFLAGYVFMRILFGNRLPWDPLQKLFSYKKISFPPPPSASGSSSGNNSGRVTQKELDALLDKLSTSGINSLSPYELERLRKARKQMRGEE